MLLMIDAGRIGFRARLSGKKAPGFHADLIRPAPGCPVRHAG
jgi:hypothetical protein